MDIARELPPCYHRIVNTLVNTTVRFLLTTFAFFLFLNILAVPILISQAPQGGTWFFSNRLMTFWNVFFLTALILSFLRMHLVRQRNPIPEQLLLFVIGTLMLHALLLVLPFLRFPQDSAVGGRSRLSTPHRIFYASNRFIWAGNEENTVRKPVLIVTPGQKDPFKVYPEGVFDPEQNALRILQTGEVIPLYDRITNQRPFLLATLWKDLGHFTRKLTPRHAWDPVSLLSVATFILLLVSLYSLVHLTRWTLFNTLLALSVPFLTIPSITFLDEWIPSLSYLPAILHGGLAILCFGLGIVFPPSTK
ncbi:MAG: hypothetical protein Kow009_01300 [Spirochaetales bacterium]